MMNWVYTPEDAENAEKVKIDEFLCLLGDLRGEYIQMKNVLSRLQK